MVARLAWRLAIGGSRDRIWRPIAVFVATLAAAVVLMIGISVLAAAQRENGRVAARAGSAATTESPDDLFVYQTYDLWDQRQFEVILIEPTDPRGDTVLPPGMTELPAVGASVVSPALDQAADEHPLLAARYPDRTVLGDEGYRSSDELLAYVRAEPAELASFETAFRVGGFGTTGAAFDVGGSEETVVFPLVVGGVIVLILPVIALLVAALATSAPLRDGRLALLHRIGLGRRPLMKLCGLESAVLASPGAVLGAAIWSVVSPRLDAVPVVGRAVQQGDLGVPTWGAVVVVVVVTTVAAGIGSVSAWRAGGGDARPRPARLPDSMPVTRLIPLLIGVAIVVYSSLGSGRTAAARLLVGVAVCAASLHLASPFIVRRAGEIVGRWHRHVSVLLAARRLQRQPTDVSRALIGVASLLVVLPGVLAFVSVVRAADDGRSQTTVESALVSASARPAEWQDFEDRASDVSVVIPVTMTRRTIGLGTTCQELERALRRSFCEPTGNTTAVAVPEDIVRSLKLPPGRRVVLNGDSEPPGRRRQMLVIKSGGELFAQEIRTAAHLALPRPLVQTEEELSENPLVRWIVGGMATAVSLATLSLVMHMLDRFVRLRRDHRQLQAIGFARRQIRRLESTYFGVAYGAVCGSGLAVGCLVAWLFVRMQPGANYPAKGVLVIGAVAASVGVAGALLVGRLVARDQR